MVSFEIETRPLLNISKTSKTSNMKHVMRFNFFLLLPLLLMGLFANGQVAQTPPMGWNSYNCFGSAVHEDEVKANADYVSRHLKSFGWQYIVVDFLWSY